MPNKKISELSENINPSGSDIFPVVHSGETMYQTLSGLTEYVSNNMIEKVYFYEINYNGSPTLPIENPIGVSGYTVQNARITAPYLFEAFGTTHSYITGTTYANFYQNMLFEVVEENGINIDGLQFSSVTALSEYLTVNLSATTANTVANKFTVKMYGVKKNTYPKINKIRGMNLFFSNLRGRNSYWREVVNNKTTFNRTKLNTLFAAETSKDFKPAPYLYDFTQAIYQRFLSVDASIYNQNDVKRTIWLASDPKRFYNLLPLSLITTPNTSYTLPNGGGGREMFNGGGFTVGQPVSIVDSAIFLLNENADTFYYTQGLQLNSGIKNSDGISVFFDNGYGNWGNVVDLPILSKTGKYDNKGTPTLVNWVSAIRVYHLQDSGGNSCFYIKPIGEDMFVVDYMENNTDAILYGLFNPRENGKQMVCQFLDNTKSINKTGNATWRIQLDDYEFLTLNQVTPKANFVPYKFKKQMGRYNKNSFKDFRLFYGYPDGTISQLSDDEIIHIVNASGYPVKRIVKKNPIN